MGDEQDRDLELSPEPQQILLHHRARLRIERAEGLVHQQDGRLVGERPRDADPLLHATRKLGRIAMGETGQADHIEQFVGDGARPGAPFPLGIGSECDVVPDRFPREQRVLLEYHATIGTGADDLISVNPDPSGGRANIAGDRVEQCGFAAARGAEQAHERAGVDIDGRVFERVNGPAAAAKPYRYVPNLDAPAIERRPAGARLATSAGDDLASVSITTAPVQRASASSGWSRPGICVLTTAEEGGSHSCRASTVPTA